jgi:hypothetical protein
MAVVMRPSWFLYRQGKAEEARPGLLKLTGPNLRESYIGVERGDNGLWGAFMRHAPDGDNVAALPPELPTEYDAWEAAFEIYRNAEII